MTSPADPTDQEIERMLLRTWDHIGPDCLQCAEECDPKFRGTFSRAEVVGSVLDYADPQQHKLTPEATKKWDDLGYDGRQKFAKKTFKYARYGW